MDDFERRLCAKLSNYTSLNRFIQHGKRLYQYNEGDFFILVLIAFIEL